MFTHACSVWLTCYLAFYRLITVAHCVMNKIKNPKILKHDVNKIMGFILLAVFSLMIVNFLVYDVKSVCKKFLCDYQSKFSAKSLLKCPNNITEISSLIENDLNHLKFTGDVSCNSILNEKTEISFLGILVVIFWLEWTNRHFIFVFKRQQN